MNRLLVFLCLLGISSGLLIFSSEAPASGFALVEQGGKGLGNAYSGGSTDTEDASSIFYNPSAIAFMEDDEVTISLSLIDVSDKFRDFFYQVAGCKPTKGMLGAQYPARIKNADFTSIYGGCDRSSLFVVIPSSKTIRRVRFVPSYQVLKIASSRDIRA